MQGLSVEPQVRDAPSTVSMVNIVNKSRLGTAVVHYRSAHILYDVKPATAWACGVVGYHARLAYNRLREGSGSIPDMSIFVRIVPLDRGALFCWEALFKSLYPCYRDYVRLERSF